jgi:hypothetical protein
MNEVPFKPIKGGFYFVRTLNGFLKYFAENPSLKILSKEIFNRKALNVFRIQIIIFLENKHLWNLVRVKKSSEGR